MVWGHVWVMVRSWLGHVGHGWVMVRSWIRVMCWVMVGSWLGHG